jgi:hypothetical protein
MVLRSDAVGRVRWQMNISRVAGGARLSKNAKTQLGGGSKSEIEFLEDFVFTFDASQRCFYYHLSTLADYHHHHARCRSFKRSASDFQSVRALMVT